MSEHVPDTGSEYRVAIHDDVGLPQQESIDHVGQIAQDLSHPVLCHYSIVPLSCGFSVVVIEHAAESLPFHDLAIPFLVGFPHDARHL